MKRRQSMRICEDEFDSACQTCDIDPNTICTFENMKCILKQIPEKDQTEWIKDLLDSDTPKLEFTPSVPQAREFFLALFVYSRNQTGSSLPCSSTLSFDLGKTLHSFERASCFKRRCESLLDAFVAGKILTDHDAVTSQG